MGTSFSIIINIPSLHLELSVCVQVGDNNLLTHLRQSMYVCMYPCMHVYMCSFPLVSLKALLPKVVASAVYPGWFFLACSILGSRAVASKLWVELWICLISIQLQNIHQPCMQSA